MCAASSSLPVPDSPVSSTRASVRAASVACSRTFPKAGLDPIMRAAPAISRKRRFSSRSLEILQSVLERQQHLFAAERLLQKIEGSGARGLHGLRDGPVAGDHQRRRGDVIGAQPAHQVDAAAVGQAHVDQVTSGRCVNALASATVDAGAHAVALALQNQLSERPIFSSSSTIKTRFIATPASRAHIDCPFDAIRLARDRLKRNARASQFPFQGFQIAPAQQRTAPRDR